MQKFVPGQANTIYADILNKSTGDPITSGTVTSHLVSVTGGNAGKWWNSATSTWSDTEVSAGAMSHLSDGHWTVSIAASAWINGTRYRFYWKESGDLHVSVSDDLTEYDDENPNRILGG